jgi:HD-like signal output (HDOD) protein
MSNLLSWFKSFLSRSAASDRSPKSSEVREVQLPGGHSPTAAAFVLDPSPVSVDTLKQFVPMRMLGEEKLASMSYAVRRYQAGAILFEAGEDAECVPYLLGGEVCIQPKGDFSYEVASGGASANLPLNSGRTFGATVTAKSAVKVVCFGKDVVQQWGEQSRSRNSFYELRNIALPEPLASNGFFYGFCQAYREQRLQLPSLPEVAFKLREAMQKDIGSAEVADIVQLDPAVVAKLIQAANSPLYAPLSPITNCLDAVSWLGLETTRNLVMSISLKQLFRTDDAELKKAMQSLWKQSLLVSSLSFVLAQESGSVKAEDALLAGLVADIGVIPLLQFAETHGGYPGFEQLESAVPYLRGPVGSLMLHTLGFAESLWEIPFHAEDWFYDSGEKLGLVDVVILAKLHSMLGSRQSADLPFINTIPAYSKLKQGELDPEASLAILSRAKERINAAMAMLS